MRLPKYLIFKLEASCEKVKLERIELEQLLDEERPHGEWIEQTDYVGDTYYECSACKETWTTIDGTPMENSMNYCPNCGADMREGD